jgi:hypothetical protein
VTTIAILTLALLLQTPPPATPVEPVPAILDAFRTHQVVALGDGRSQGDAQMRTLLFALLRDPRFAATANDLVVEFGNARYQDVVDRHVRGENVLYQDLAQIWRNTTQLNATQRDCASCAELLNVVRDVNKKNSSDRQLRVLLGDPPIDWDAVRTPQDHMKFMEMRDTFPADLIRREVLDKKRRALVVYGGMHLQRKHIMANYESEGLAATIVSELEKAGTKVFSVFPANNAEKTQPEVATWKAPSLAIVRGTLLGAPDFATFSRSPAIRVTLRDGRPDFSRPVPREEWRELRMEDQFDAILYLGPMTEMEQTMVMDPSLCSDSGFMKILRSRWAIVGGPKPEIKRLDDYCAGIARR